MLPLVYICEKNLGMDSGGFPVLGNVEMHCIPQAEASKEVLDYSFWF